jgi:hypothetical protein
MATLPQIEANRRNSQKSTGPRSVEGKTVSRFNALKTGIDAKSQVIPGEESAELTALAEQYRARFQPATPEQRLMIDTLVTADWRLRRYRKVEAQLWEFGIGDAGSALKENCPLGYVFYRRDDTFIRLQRCIDSAERSCYRALEKLERLQSANRPVEQVPTPVELPASPAAPGPEPLTAQSRRPPIGFVPQKAVPPQIALRCDPVSSHHTADTVSLGFASAVSGSASRPRPLPTPTSVKLILNDC